MVAILLCTAVRTAWVLNSFDLLPPVMVAPLRLATAAPAAIAVGALGPGLDLRTLGRVGARVSLVVAVSLLAQIGTSLALTLLLRPP
ncbi:MAG: hypothetical protein ACJ8H8_32675 [Geminicoccaceae bacterium]